MYVCILPQMVFKVNTPLGLQSTVLLIHYSTSSGHINDNIKYTEQLMVTSGI